MNVGEPFDERAKYTLTTFAFTRNGWPIAVRAAVHDSPPEHQARAVAALEGALAASIAAATATRTSRTARFHEETPFDDH
jgi:hypothetical protein